MSQYQSSQPRDPRQPFGRSSQPSVSTPGTQPLGRQQPRSTSIEQFSTPPSRTPWLILIGVVVLVGVLIGGFLIGTQRPPAPTPSPTVAASRGPGIPFSMPNDTRSKGRWEILGTEWSNDGVTLDIRIYADQGTISYDFFAFTNDGRTSYEPETPKKRPELVPGTLTAGNSVRGYVFLPLPRKEATLLLTSFGGTQALSAQPIKP